MKKDIQPKVSQIKKIWGLFTQKIKKINMSQNNVYNEAIMHAETEKVEKIKNKISKL
jgi:hypothetical protein